MWLSFQKFRNIHFLSLMGNGIMSVLILVFTAILYRSLSVREIGIWIFFQTSLSFLDTFRNGFLTTAFIKFYAGSTKQRAEEIIGSTWYIASVITAFFLLFNVFAFFALPYINEPSLTYFLKYFSINLVCSLPMLLAICIAQAELKFDRLLYIRAAQVIMLMSFLILLIVTKKNNLTYLMYANIIAALLTSLLCLVAGWTGIKHFFKKTRSAIKELYHFGKYTVGTSISANLFGVTDTFIINFMLGPAALGIYNIGKRLTEIVEIPLRSFVATAFPEMSIAYNQKNKEQVIYIMKKYTGMLTVALIPVMVVIFIFAPQAIGIIGGEKYIGTEAGLLAANVLRLFFTFALLYPADRFLAITLDVIHKPQINFYKIIVMLVINLVTDVIGIYFFKNIYGVALATIFPVITAIIISRFALQKYYMRYSFFDTYLLGYKELVILMRSFVKNKMAI